MDFCPDEAQQAVTRAAAGVLKDAGPPPHGEAWDWPVWQKLGHAGLLSLAVPDWLGGDGLGVLPVVRWGDREAQAGVLAGVAAGDVRGRGRAGRPAALRACHHLHGGLGMDVSYPLHRYSALVGDLVALVGGADYALDRLGQRAGTGAGAGG